MVQRGSDDLASCSSLGRTEVLAAIESLAGEVARLARKLNSIVESAKRAGDTPDAFASDLEVLPYEAEAKYVALSPGQNAAINESIAGELAEDACTNFASTRPEPTQVCRLEENAIAARVADLYERLGGFIKPSLPKSPDGNI